MNTALVIGAGGGIGRAMVNQLIRDNRHERIYALSRQQHEFDDDRVTAITMDTADESAVAEFCQHRRQQGETLSLAVCCVGILHDRQVFPEKKLEDISATNLSCYFAVNTVVPALWLSHLVKLFPKKERAVLAVLSARVGSISDNRLGGWYGYRASKAALNMLLKTAQIEYQRRARGTALVAYHPGTVDTGLSEPFQGNVPEGKLFTPSFTAECFMQSINDLEARQGPYYLDWQGQAIDW